MTETEKDFIYELCQALLQYTWTTEAILILKSKTGRMQIIAAPDTLQDEHMKNMQRIIERYVAKYSTDERISFKNRDGEAFS